MRNVLLAAVIAATGLSTAAYAEGKKIETTQWFRATAWEGLATIAEKYMVKGKQVAISGKLVNKNWTDKDGKACNATEILVSDILLMGGKKD